MAPRVSDNGKADQTHNIFRLNIEILRIVEERLSARLTTDDAVDPGALALEIINDDLSKGFSWHELIEIIEAAAEELDVPTMRPLARMSREH